MHSTPLVASSRPKRSIACPTFRTPRPRSCRANGAPVTARVVEAIAASHLRMQILGLSLATNLAAGLSPVPLDGDHIVAVARENAPWVADLLLRLITALAAQRTT